MIEFRGSGRSGRASKCRTRRLVFEPLEDLRLLAPVTMSVDEQMVVELINRARSDPAAEAARLGIDLNEGWAPGTIAPSPKQPLAPHQSLINAARAHSQDMVDRDFFAHTNPDGKNPRDRMVAAGYTPRSWGENIADGYWTEVRLHEGLFLSPPHRVNLLSDNFREIGVGLVYSSNHLFTGTEKFARRDGDVFLTGVVFSDQLLGDDFLTPGEGLGNVTVSAQRDGGGATYTATTGPSGGYSLQLPAGVYDLKAEGGDLTQTLAISNTYVGSQNVKVDFVVPYVPPEADRYEPNNTVASATTLSYGDQTLEHLTIRDENDDDYFRWTAHQDGQLRVEIDLRRDSGAPSLSLLNTEGTQLTNGTWSDNGRSLTWDVEAGQSYVIWVTPYDAQQQLLDQSHESGTTKTVSTNVVAGDCLYVFVEASDDALVSDYSLRIDGVMLPVAADDRTFTEPGIPVEINLLLNDRSDDGELDAATLRFVSLPQYGQVQSAGADGTISYVPDPDFLGVDRFTYAISDDRGNESAPATVQITVLDPTNHPWQNPHNALDVNSDGYVTPVDALQIINCVNQQGIGPLVVPPNQSSFPLPFYDVNGDDYVSPVDSLRIINFLNSPGGDGEGESPHVVALGTFLRDFFPIAPVPVIERPERPDGDVPILNDATPRWCVEAWSTGTDPAAKPPCQVRRAADTLQRHQLATGRGSRCLELDADSGLLPE